MKNADTASEMRMSRTQRTRTRRAWRPDDLLLGPMGVPIVPAGDGFTLSKSLSEVEVINRYSRLSYYIQPGYKRVSLEYCW